MAGTCPSADLLDIEDFGDGVEGGVPTTRHQRRLVLPKRTLKKDAPTGEVAVGDSHIPGNATIFLRTWGCSHNNSDGEYMAGLLSAYGYTITGAAARISSPR